MSKLIRRATHIVQIAGTQTGTGMREDKRVVQSYNISKQRELNVKVGFSLYIQRLQTVSTLL